MPRLSVLQGMSKEESRLAALVRALRERVRGEVRFSRHDRMLYATDASMYQVEPMGVIIPADTDDALEAVRAASELGLPILPRGGGTSLAGQATSEAVVVDLSAHCRGIRCIDDAARSAWVDAGITIDDLNDRLGARGLFFAPDPSTSRQANIGGCVGNNAAGTRSIRYGRTSENILGLDVALADGTRLTLGEGAARRDPITLRLTAGVIDVVRRHEALIRERFPKTVRRNAGYGLDMVLSDLDSAARDGVDPMERLNLAKLLCGSEGTLAVTLGAQLALHPTPKATGLAVVGFNDLMRSIECVGAILETGPVAVELMDDLLLDLARANTECSRYLGVMPEVEGTLKAVLYVEYYSDTGPEEIEAKFAELRAVMDKVEPGAGIRELTSSELIVPSLNLRKAGVPLLLGIPGDRKPVTFVEDNAVPVERLPEFVRGFKEIVAEHGTIAAYYAHASVGVLHVRPLLDPKVEADRERMTSIAILVADLAKSLGGVMSGEHGDGRLRGPLLERFYGPELMGAFGEVKAVFDPEGRLNPGNIVDAGQVETMHASTRYRPDEKMLSDPEIETFYSYDDQNGFLGAVEMCNGAGACRKTSGGVMCPSYMASLDERHATRGRGNALRLAITGQFSGTRTPDWDDPETKATLNLCLSCKACKSECPSNVDIAKLKAEYTAQSNRHTERTPLSARVFAGVRTLNKLGSIAPGLSNAVNATPMAKWVAEKLLGIDRRRDLPAFSRPLRLPAKPGDERPAVGLFADCFCTYNETDVGRDAARVLEAFGYRPVLIDAGCCARPHISTGLLPQAIRTADATLARIDRAMSEIETLIVLEPSCLSAITDDWPMLKLESPREVVERVAGRATLLERFLDERWDEHPVRPEFREIGREVLLHAHCHQKALWGAGSSGGLLSRIAGDRLHVADTTCCGMAGAFGFTTDRYDFSMRIGERSVFPAVREHGGDVLAPGTSCRHQIADGTGAGALHPASWLARQLV